MKWASLPVNYPGGVLSEYIRINNADPETLPPGVRTGFRKVVEAPQWQRPTSSCPDPSIVGDPPTSSHYPRGAPARLAARRAKRY